MPRDLQQLLEDTATGPTQPLDARRIVRRARRRRLTTRVGLSAASTLAVVVVVAAAASVIDTRPDNDVLLEPGGQPSPPTGQASGSWRPTRGRTPPRSQTRRTRCCCSTPERIACWPWISTLA